MQSLRNAAEIDASECQRLRATLQKQEEQQLQQQQQFASLLEALELENRDLRELQVSNSLRIDLNNFSSHLDRPAGASLSTPATRMLCSCSTKTNS